MADESQVRAMIDAETIELELVADDRDAAILELANRLALVGRIDDPAAITAAALVREAIGSTNVGFGVAIPHAKSDHVTRAGFAFGRRAGGVRWPGDAVADAGEPGDESGADNRVDLVFLIASPAQASDDHLRMLAALARALMHEDFRDALRTTATREETITLLATTLAG